MLSTPASDSSASTDPPSSSSLPLETVVDPIPAAPSNESDFQPFIDIVKASPEFKPVHSFGEYLTSPFDTPYTTFDDFNSPIDDSPFIADLSTPIMEQIDEFEHNIVDPTSGWINGEDTAPLFNDAGLEYYQHLVQPEAVTKESQQPAESAVMSSAKLYTFSPSTPALDNFNSPLTQPIHSPVTRTAPSLYSAPRVPTSNASVTNRARSKSRAPSAAATGTRRDITPATMVPLDAPTQSRNYILPSSTSRKTNPLHAQKRTHSEAFGQSQEQDELPDEAPPGPNATQVEHIEWKRRQNTIAARKSRRRKLEYLRELEADNGELREDRDKWKTRCGVLEGVLKANGMMIPAWEDE